MAKKPENTGIPGIRITAKKDGFRRCGIAHSSQATIHSCDLFTEEQITALRAEPNLIVEDIAIPGEAEASGTE